MARDKIQWNYLKEFDFLSNQTIPKLKKLITNIERILLLGGKTLDDNSFYKFVCIQEFAKNLLLLLTKSK